MEWKETTKGPNYDWVDGEKVIARITKLGPTEWAWDVLGIPNAASRATSLNKARELAEEAWKEYNASNIRYQVLERILTSWGWSTNLRIWREDRQEITLSWSDLQLIKNEAVGPDVTMVEFYPSEDMVVNKTNMRHFFTIDREPPMKP